MGASRRTFVKRMLQMAAAAVGLRRLERLPAAPAPVGAVVEPTDAQVVRLMASSGWRELKSTWQEMTRHASRQVQDQSAFDKLKAQVGRAFATLGKEGERARIAPEFLGALRVAVEERHQHLARTLYASVDCYQMTLMGGALEMTRDRLEKQYALLGKMEAQARIKPEVADKARRAIARRIEFQTRARRIWAGGGQTGEDELLRHVDRKSFDVKPDLVAGPQSRFVARLLVDLSRP